MSAIGKVRIMGRSATEASFSSVSIGWVPKVLPVSAWPVSMDALLGAVRGAPAAARVLPTQRPNEFQSTLSATPDPGVDVVLLDLRNLRPSVAYRLVARARAGAWRGSLVIVVAEHDLGLVPTARRFGASDFVLPTMSAAELAIRLFAISPPVPGPDQTTMTDPSPPVGHVALEWRTHELVSGSMRAQLTLRELQLLEVLLSRKGVTTPTAELARLAWGKSSRAGRTLAATYVCSLRKKLAWFGGEFGVRTIRGVGYRFELVAR